MGRIDKHYDPSSEHGIEQLRLGTRRQYISDWTLIPDGATKSFTHGLGEVPWVCDVVKSETADGKNPTSANADVTASKTSTAISVESALGSDAYFQVRAL